MSTHHNKKDKKSRELKHRQDIWKISQYLRKIQLGSEQIIKDSGRRLVVLDLHSWIS